MTIGQKWLVYLGPLIGTGIGGYMYLYWSNEPGKFSFIGIAWGMAILIISLVGLLGAWLLARGKQIGFLLMTLSGVLSLPLMFSIPNGIYELIVVVVLAIKGVPVKTKVSDG